MRLTEKQSEILTFLQSYFDDHGFAPSTRDITKRFGFASQTAAVNHLRALAKKGAINRPKGIARGIKILAA